MFLNDTDIEKNVLRQGDIINDTHILGAINLNGITYLSEPNGNIKGYQVSSIDIRPAIILSHSCELDRAGNGIKVTSIILAPLRDVNSATKPEKVKELIDSNLLSATSEASYLKYFYIEPHTLLPQFPRGCIVDFSKCYSVREKSYDQILNNKIIQLRSDISDGLAIKLALYYYRRETA